MTIWPLSVAVLCDYSCFSYLPQNDPFIVWWGTECLCVFTDSAYLLSCRRDTNTKREFCTEKTLKAAHLTWLIQTVLKNPSWSGELWNIRLHKRTVVVFFFFAWKILNGLQDKCTVRTAGMIRDYFMYNCEYGHVSGKLSCAALNLQKQG